MSNRVYAVVATRADDRCTQQDLDELLFWASTAPWLRYVVVEFGDPIPGRDPLRPLRETNAVLVHVPSELADPQQSPGVFGEYCAKNVGIRVIRERIVQRGDPLVICTNMDCFFSPALIGSIEALKYDADALYRAERATFNGKVPPDGVKGCHINTIGKWGGEAAGDFTGMHLSSWSALKGYAESPWRQMHVDSELTDRALVNGKRLVRLEGVVYHRAHGNSRSAARAGASDALTTPSDQRALAQHEIKKAGVSSYRVIP